MLKPRRAVACTMAFALLAGCASQAALDNLAMAQQQYNVMAMRCQGGDQQACAYFPVASAALVQAQQEVEAEKQASAAVGLAVVGVAAGAAAAAAAAPGPGPGPGPGYRPPPPRPRP